MAPWRSLCPWTPSPQTNFSWYCSLQVEVKRRETERQQESRLNSYAYLTEREQQEPWRELHAIPPRADIVNSMLYKAMDEAVPMELSQQDYSCAILPGKNPFQAA